MIAPLASLERRSRPQLMAVALGLVAVIGVVDYLAGYEMFFSVFYLLAVGLAAWYVGKTFGLIISILSVLVWLGGDMAAGAHYSSSLVPIWNALILTTFYFVVVWLLDSLRSFNRKLEDKVQLRTTALTREMVERQRLEREILKVSEQERQRIGHDLHDSLCQHLTATALAAQVLSERLAAKSLPDSAASEKVVELVEEGINLARTIARGLSPLNLEAEGLMASFQELAATLTRTSGILCRFECGSPILVHDDATATHLYRIAQEAVSNAIRHGRAGHILISLSARGALINLAIEDDGVGFNENAQKSEGLGIRIMAHRATMIGGSLSIEPAPTGGTIVTCSLPKNAVECNSSQA